MTYISRKIRRKYQTGGIIPSFEGFRSFSRTTPLPQIRPPQPSVDITPLVQANNVVQQNLRTAIARAAESRAERQDMWNKEVNHRNFMQDRITELRGEITAGINKANLLDYNIAEQRMLGEQMNKEMERYKQMGLDALTNERLKPQDRYERLQEAVMGTQQLFTNPEYSNYVKANNLTQKFLDKAMEDLADNDKLVDNNQLVTNFGKLNEVRANPALLGKFFEKYVPHEIDVEAGKTFQESVIQMLKDALSEDAAVIEKYSGNQNAVTFIHTVRHGTEDQQTQAVYEMLMGHEPWKRWSQHPGSGQGLTVDGVIDDIKAMDFARGVVRMVRTSKGVKPEQTERIIGAERHGSAYNTAQQKDSGKQAIISDLQNTYGLGIRAASALDTAVDSGHSAAVINFIRNNDMTKLMGPEYIGTDFYKYKDEYDDAFAPMVGPTPIGGTSPIPAGALDTVPASFFNAIDLKESEGDYDALYDFVNKKSGEFANTRVSQMTLGKLKEFSTSTNRYGQSVKDKIGYVSTPMGRYQITGSTLAEMQEKMGLSDDTIFSPEIQDRMASQLFIDAVESADTLEGKREALRGRWEGFEARKMPTGQLDQIILDYEENKGKADQGGDDGIAVDINEGGGTPEGTPQEQRGRSYLPFGGQRGIFGNIPVGPLPFGVNPRKQSGPQVPESPAVGPVTTKTMSALEALKSKNNTNR